MKSIYPILIIGLVISINTTISGQNMPLYTQYSINPFVINPAATGIEDGHRLYAQYRLQWQRFPSAPETGVLTYSGQFGRAGVGLMLFKDVAGSMEYNGFLGGYNYRLPLTKTSNIAIGLSVQMLRYQLRVRESQLTSVDLTDPVVIDAMNGVNTLEGSIGAFYTHDNGLYIGLSVPNLIQTKLSGESTVGNNLDYLTTHYIGFAGYKIEHKGITFDPSCLIRKVAATPFQVELNAKAWFVEEKLMAGIGYRTAENSIAFLFGTNIENVFRFFYSYDTGFNRLSDYHLGSHEFTVGIRVGKKKEVIEDDL